MLSVMPAVRRIASLLSSATEILYGLGLEDRVVAVSHECDFPPDVWHKPRVTVSHVDSSADSQAIDTQVQEMVRSGQALYGIDVERLAALAPDLIVTQAQCDVCSVRYQDVLAAVEQHECLLGTRIVALNPQSLAEILSDILCLGEVAECPDAAREYVARLQARVEAVRAKTAVVPPTARPRVVCIEWIEPLMLAANWVPQLIEWAGGQNQLTTGGQHSTYARWEDVLGCDPDVIIVSPCGFDLPRTLEEARTLPQRPGWADLNAVRAGRVYAVDGNAYLNRTGPRIVDSLEILAYLLHPELGIRPPGPLNQALCGLQLQ